MDPGCTFPRAFGKAPDIAEEYKLTEKQTTNQEMHK